MTMRPHDKAWATGPDALLKSGFELALVLVDAAEASGSMVLSWFEHAAARCAAAGVPIEAVHAAVRDSVKTALAEGGPVGEPVTCTWESGIEPGAVGGVVDMLTSAVTRAYAE
ncbi:hypothetical protein [Nocardia sp. NPDC051463]|uniref:hypothetical protein n=1 Tax=Nocardia sp. NPDC051463 TaxID=3154845 RepID=UPI00343C2551